MRAREGRRGVPRGIAAKIGAAPAWWSKESIWRVARFIIAICMQALSLIRRGHAILRFCTCACADAVLWSVHRRGASHAQCARLSARRSAQARATGDHGARAERHAACAAHRMRAPGCDTRCGAMHRPPCAQVLRADASALSAALAPPALHRNIACTAPSQHRPRMPHATSKLVCRFLRHPPNKISGPDQGYQPRVKPSP